MRFFKIFLIVFFSLIGVFGITYGIMAATGYFNQEKISPENISFEKNIYNEVGELDNDGNVSFDMMVTTTTADVTEKSITLSFKNQSLPVVNGRISDGVISIPQYAKIGETFKVYISQEYNETLGSNWNRGGSSTIIAKTDIVGVTQAEAKVNIDVPVSKFSINAVAGNGEVVGSSEGGVSQSPTFSVNSTFTIEPVFYPEESEKKFSGDELKSVYYNFSIPQGNVNDYIEDLGFINGKRTFRALLPTDDSITITAFCFNNSIIENEMEALYQDEEDIISQFTSANGKSASISVSFVTQKIESFTMSQSSAQLPYNKASEIFVNSQNEHDYSLGIEIHSSDTSIDMSYKYEDIGLRIVLDNDVPENAVEVIGYSKIVDGDGKEVSSDYEGVKYYLPNTNLTNMNMSYWTIVTNSPDVYFSYEVIILGEENEFSDTFQGSKTLTSSIWSVAGKVDTQISWKDETPITLVYEDSENQEDIVHKPYNLFNNLEIVEGSYMTIKYIAYMQKNNNENISMQKNNNENISDIISDINTNSLFNFETIFSSFGITDLTNYSYGEIVGDEITTKSVGSFNVIAVVIETDYLGAPILENGKYNVVTIVKSQDYINVVQPLEFTITKTLKYIKSYAIVDKGTLAKITALKNLTIDGIKNAEDENYDEIYAFKYNSTLPSFYVEIVFDKNDKEIFINAWNNNLITIQFINDQNLPTNVITYNMQNIAGTNIVDREDGNTSAIYVPFYVSQVSEDIELSYKLIYQKTAEKQDTFNIYDYNDETTKKFEVYDGNPDEIYFVMIEVVMIEGKENKVETKIETSDENRISESINITTSSETDGIYTAEKITTKYTFDGKDLVADNLYDENGNYYIIYKDKYDNRLGEGDTVTGQGDVGQYERIDEGEGQYHITVSTLTKSSQLSSFPTADLYFEQETLGGNFEIEYRSSWDNGGGELTDAQIGSTIETTITGKTGTTVTLQGGNVINIYYVYNDGNGEEKYLLNEVTQYSSSNISSFTDWLSLESGVLKIKKDFGINANLKLTASVPELNIKQDINLTINPEIVLTGTTIDPTQAGAEDVGENPVYQGVYAEEKFTIELTFERKPNGISATKGTMRTDYLTTDGLTLELNFSASEIGQQVVTIYTGDDVNNTSYGFKQNLYFNVVPNVKVDNSDGSLVYENGVLNLGIKYFNSSQSSLKIFGADGLISLVKRFDRNNEINLDNLNNIYLSFSNIGLSNNDDNFEIINEETGATLSLKSGSVLNDKKEILLYIVYGGGENYQLVQAIKLIVSADIIVGDTTKITGALSTDNSKNLTHTAFANYNTSLEQDKQHLVLVSGYTYTYSNILALFKDSAGKKLTSERYSLSFEAGGKNYTLNDGSISITGSISTYIQSKMTITLNDVGSVVFDVLLVPGDYEFVKYNPTNDKHSNQEYTNLINSVNKNIYLLNDVEYLQDEEIYDSYNGGQTYNIYFDTTDETVINGISSFYKENAIAFNFKIINEDGSSNNYITFNSNTGTMTTGVFGEEKFVRIECWSGNNRIFVYRIKVVPTAVINTYYPYILDKDMEANAVAEYLDFVSDAGLQINLKEKYGESIPNSGKSRFVLENEQEDGSFEEVENASLSFNFSVKSVKVGDITIADNYINDYATISSDGILSINYVASSMVTIVVQAEAFINGQSIGATADYTFIVGYNYENLEFRNGEDLQTSYNKSTITVKNGETINLDDVVALAKVNNEIATKSDLLRFHIYDYLGTNESKIKFDKERNTISLEEGVSLVSDLSFKLVLYTRYGKNTAYKEIDVIFKSTYSAELTADSASLWSSDGEYSTYAGKTIDLSSCLTVKVLNGDTDAIISDWSISDHEVLYEGTSTEDITRSDKELIISSIKKRKVYTITLCIDVGEDETYNYTFNLTVYPHTVTKYTQTNPKDLGEKLATTEFTVEVINKIDGDGNELVPPDEALVPPDYALFKSVYDGAYEFIIIQGRDAIVEEQISGNNIPTKAVAENTTVVIRVDYKTGGPTYISAYITFVVKPNTTVTLNYPSASGEPQTREYVYLKKDSTLTSPPTFDLDLNAPALFQSSKRVDVKTEEGTTGGAVSYEVSYEAKYDDSIFDVPGSNGSYTINWKNDTTVTSGTINFIIKVDGIVRETYVLVVDSNISNVYTYEITPFNDTENDAEIFIVDNNNAMNIFSNRYQLLTFQARSNLGETTITGKNDAKISVDGGSTFLDEITLSSADAGQDIKMILYFSGSSVPTDLLDLYGTDTNSFANFFTIDGGKNFSDIAVPGTAEVKTRFMLYYKGNLVDYSKIKSVLKVGSSDLDKYSLSVQGTSEDELSITITINGNAFATYKYKVVLDFKIGNGKTVQSGFMDTLYANEIVNGILGVSGDTNIWTITRYNGQNYTREYFDEYADRTISMSVFLVTTTNFDYTTFKPSNKYQTGDEILFVEGNSATFNHPCTYSPIISGSKTYDFNLSANGAQYGGNYVIFKVTYSVNIGSETKPKYVTEDVYIMVKILPDWTHTLSNSNNPASIIPNTQQTPLYIYNKNYDNELTSSEVTLPFNIAEGGTSSRVVIKHTKGAETSTNFANAFSYIISDNLKNYISVSSASVGGNIIIEQGNSYPVYGNVEGYIEIKDSFGYSLKYYVVLVASNSSPVSIAQIIDSSGNSADNLVWEDSVFALCDYKTYSEKTDEGRSSLLLSLKADYVILINGYSGIESGKFNFSALKEDTAISGLIQNIKDIDIKGVKYKAFKFNMMGPEFYGGALSVPIRLQISIDVSSENVLIYSDLNLKQRYTTAITNANTNYVLDNVEFDVSNYIDITDRKMGVNLGTAFVGNADYSLNFANVVLPSGYIDVKVEIKREGSVAQSGKMNIYSYQLTGGDQQLFYLSDFEGFESVDFSTYDKSNIQITEIKYYGTGSDPNISSDNISIVKDKKVSLNTINSKDETDSVNLNVQVGTNVKQIEFKLNYDGTQTKSLYYQLNSDPDNSVSEDVIWSVTLSDLPLTSEDRAKVKGMTIYSDTISVLVPQGFGNNTVTFTVNEKDYTYTNNLDYAHYIHIQLSTILGKTYYTSDEIKNETSYTVYTVRITTSSEGVSVTYEGKTSNDITIGDFTIRPITGESELIDIKSINQFNENKKTSIINKGYVVKFAKSSVYNVNTIGYTVTPNPYAVDTAGNTGTFGYKQIDASKYILEDGVYTIKLENWAEGYSVLDASGKIIGTLTEYVNGGKLKLGISDLTPDGFGSGSGSASIDDEGKITTNENFKPGEQSIAVSIKAIVDGNDTIDVGTIYMVLTNNIINFPSVGAYVVQRTAKKLGETSQLVYDSVNVNINTINERQKTIEELFPNKDDGWQYNYTIVKVFEDTSKISTLDDDSSKLSIELKAVQNRTLLKNKKVTAVIQAMSKTSGEILTSEDLVLTFDANGYNLTAIVEDSSEVEDPSDKINVSQNKYHYTVTVLLSTLFGDSLTTGLNYMYYMIITDYGVAQGESTSNVVEITEFNEVGVDQIYVFKTTATKGETSLTKYLGFVADNTDITIALDIGSAFSGTGFTGDGVVYATEFTGLMLDYTNSTISTMFQVGYDSNNKNAFISPSIENDDGTISAPISHSWVMVATSMVATSDSNNIITKYASLLTVSLKYNQSFVFGGVGNFSNSLSDNVSLEDLKNNSSRYVFYDNDNITNYIKQIQFTELNNNYSFYQLSYNSTGETTENYIVKNNSGNATFNLETIEKNDLLELKLICYNNIELGENFVPSTPILIKETYDDGNITKLRVREITQAYKDEMWSLSLPSTDGGIVSLYNQNSPSTINISNGNTYSLEAGLYNDESTKKILYIADGQELTFDTKATVIFKKLVFTIQLGSGTDYIVVTKASDGTVYQIQKVTASDLTIYGASFVGFEFSLDYTIDQIYAYSDELSITMAQGYYVYKLGEENKNILVLKDDELVPISQLIGSETGVVELTKKDISNFDGTDTVQTGDYILLQSKTETNKYSFIKVTTAGQNEDSSLSYIVFEFDVSDYNLISNGTIISVDEVGTYNIDCSNGSIYELEIIEGEELQIDLSELLSFDKVTGEGYNYTYTITKNEAI